MLPRNCNVFSYPPQSVHKLTAYIFASLLLQSPLAISGNTQLYTYDALGRLTFVQDNQNGNRDYDYDAAGNRVAVVVGQATDDPVLPPAPLSPSNARCNSVYAAGVYQASWSASSGASYYIYSYIDSSGSSRSETLTSTQSPARTQRCSSVKACNSANICSANSFF